MTTWAELREEAERTIELRRDVEYAGGQTLANMILEMREADDEEFAEHIAIGVHTGLRKGSEAPSSGPLWRAISESSDSAWPDACAYAVSGIKSMGYKLVREVKP
jgi:hypothetical protein